VGRGGGHLNAAADDAASLLIQRCHVPRMSSPAGAEKHNEKMTNMLARISK
jgi:hypothetical protein